MELKDIQELIKMVKKADLYGLKIKEGDYILEIKNKGGSEQTIYTSAAPAMSQPVMQQQQQPAYTEQLPAQQNATAQETKPAAAAAPNDKQFVFKSPMVGTFYRKPGADKEPFVKVGDSVKNGDTLCIIEAMKLFNEIEFDAGEGKIVKILADDSSPVEYDQPLFLIEKS